MSKVTISGNASGTGTLTIAAPNTNSDITLNLPTTMGTNNSSSVVTTNAAGNLGLGVAPSATGASYKSFELGFAGIGLNARSNATLDVDQGVYWTAGSAPLYASTGVAAAHYRLSSGTHAWYNAPSGTAGAAISFTQAMTLEASGNLGVGATSVGAMLHLRRDTASSGATVYPNIRIDNPNAAGYTGLYFYADTTLKAGFEVSNAAGALQMIVTNAERARIDSSGNLYSLSSVDGIVSASTLAAGTSNNIFLGKYSATTTTNGTTCYAVRTNGNVINTNGSYGAISDAKLKENIVDATPKLDKLNQVRIVNFNIIGDEQKQLGVIAQELEQVFPGMVDESPDHDEEGNTLGTTTKSVKYSVFVPMLVKAIQELKAIVDGQAILISAQGAQIAMQSSEIATLTAAVAASKGTA